MKNYIYLDNAATTKTDPEVLKVMLPYFKEYYGNPSSIYTQGQLAIKAVDGARHKIAKLLNASAPTEIIFTSGATESNNLAIKGIIPNNNPKNIHCITTCIEHPSVRNSFKYLESQGIKVTYLPVTREGIIREEDLIKNILPNTRLISIMYVNNEIGTIQPVINIGKIIKKQNNLRQKRGLNKIYYHIDAVQAQNYLEMNLLKLRADLVTMSGHKIYGPKGIGILYIKKGTPLRSITQGGSQEYNLRPGTLNVPGIVGIAKAIEIAENLKINGQNEKITSLRNLLIKNIASTIADIKLLGSSKERIPSNVNIHFAKIEGESIVLSLDLEGVACSTGSACASSSLEPSYVITSLGLKPEEAHGSIRFSLGKYTTKEDINYVSKKLPVIIKKLRLISPYK